jgi:multicomponent Na+:H+ antiporter subunit E
VIFDEVRMWPVTGVVMTVLWVFVRDVPLTPASITGELLIGGGIGMGIAYTFRHMYPHTVNLHRFVAATPYIVLYLYTFIRELVAGSIMVMRIVLSPRLPVRPDVVEIPLRVRSDAAITLIANSITLTPGTLTMDHDPGTNTLYVHAITGEDRETVVEPIRLWEELALRIFDEADAAVTRPAHEPVPKPVPPEVTH